MGCSSLLPPLSPSDTLQQENSASRNSEGSPLYSPASQPHAVPFASRSSRYSRDPRSATRRSSRERRPSRVANTAARRQLLPRKRFPSKLHLKNMIRLHSAAAAVPEPFAAARRSRSDRARRDPGVASYSGRPSAVSRLDLPRARKAGAWNDERGLANRRGHFAKRGRARTGPPFSFTAVPRHFSPPGSARFNPRDGEPAPRREFVNASTREPRKRGIRGGRPFSLD